MPNKNTNTQSSAGQALDDDRRDIAVLGDTDVRMLNRMAKRNGGEDPLEVSGDAITRQRKAAEGEGASESSVVPFHPLWCNAADCTQNGQIHYADPYTVTRGFDGDFDALDLRVQVVQFHFEGETFAQDPGVEIKVDGIISYLRRSDLDELIGTLKCAADDLDFIGGDGQ